MPEPKEEMLYFAKNSAGTIDAKIDCSGPNETRK